MMLKRLLLLALGSILYLESVWAAPITPEASLRIARQFFGDKQLRSTGLPLTLSYAHRPKTTGLHRANSGAVVSELPAYYFIYNRGKNNGFVVIAGDDRLEQILAYSYEGHFSLDNAPREMLYWLGTFDREIESLYRSGLLHQAKPSKQEPSTDKPKIPLLEREQIRWNQNYPFNSECPRDEITGGQCVTGCVATALAQVMRFYKWPDVGQGEHTYVDALYEAHPVTRHVTFNTHYDWQHMPGIFNSKSADKDKIVKAYGLLMRDAGHAVDMMYSSRGSGTWDTYIVHALREFFKYSRGTHLLYRGRVDYATWEKAIRKEIDEERPVIFFGQGQGGHCFVCDGYDDHGLFHFNWGWGGTANGYYRLTSLRPTELGIGSGMGFYDYSQSIVVGAKPRKEGEIDEEAPLNTPMVAIRANIVDGSKRTKLELSAAFMQNAELKMKCSLRFAMYNDVNVLVKEISASDKQEELAVYVPYSSKKTLDISGLSDGVYSIKFEYATVGKEYKPMQYSYDEPSIALVTICNHEVSHVDYDTPIDCLSVDPKSVNTDSLFCYENSVVTFKIHNTSKREMCMPAILYCVDSRTHSEMECFPNYRYATNMQLITVPAEGDSEIRFAGFRPNLLKDTKVNLYLQIPRLKFYEPGGHFGFYQERLKESAAKLIASEREIKLPKTYTEAKLVCTLKTSKEVEVECTANDVRPCKVSIANKGLLYDPTSSGAVIRGILVSVDDAGGEDVIAISLNGLSGKIRAGEERDFVPLFSLGREFDFLSETKGVLHILTVLVNRFTITGFGQQIFGDSEIPVRFVRKTSGDGMVALPEDILLYPNPATSTTTLRTAKPIAQISIESLDGICLARYKVSDVQQFVIPIHSLTSGEYIVRCATTDGKSLVTTLLVR